jgi:exo-beta-1,3-glucanase (GH17 family)
MNVVISKYFSAKELQCKCGCGLYPQQAFVDKLDAIREAYGQPIEVTNVSRCSVHNRAIGGAPKSAHVEGIAADLVRTEALLAFILANADNFNYWIEQPEKTPSWIHIDSRYRPVGRVFIP